MSVQKIADRYAKSLVDLALEQNKLDRVAEDVKHFLALTDVRDFSLLLKSPIVNPAKKEKIFEALVKSHYDVLTFSFLRIIIKKGRETYLREIAEAFGDQYNEINKISKLKLVTAIKLSEKQLDEIKDQIRNSGATHPNIELDTQVEPEIIGGFILEFEDKLYDASIAYQLDKMRKELTTK